MSRRVPDASRDHPPDPQRLRQQLMAAGWTLAEAARQAGVTPRTLERYLSPKGVNDGLAAVMPYPLQYTLEAIARFRNPKPFRK